MPRDHNRRSRSGEDSDSERRSSKRSRRDEDIPEISSESDALRHASFEDWLYDEKGRRVKDLSRDDRGHYARKFREREAEERDQSHQETAYQRKKDRREARQEAKEHQSVGKEKMLEQRAALRSSNAEFAARKDETDMAFTDDFLGLDGGNSFQQALAARERRKAKPTAKQLRAEEKAAEMEEKRAVYNEKESATMDMFKALAKERFG